MVKFDIYCMPIFKYPHAVSPINVQILEFCTLEAHWTQPFGIKLIHLQVTVRIKTLKVVAGGGPAGEGHPCFTEWTQEGTALGCRGNLISNFAGFQFFSD